MMKNGFIQDVYDTVQGNMLDGFEVPGVVNLFAPGSECEKLYDQVCAAERCLEDRLGVSVCSDEDLETIMQCMTAIQKKVGFYMYYYGAKFGMRES